MGNRKPTPREKDLPLKQGGEGNNSKKNMIIDDSEYSLGMVSSEEPTVKEDKPAPAVGKKTAETGSSTVVQAEFEVEDGEYLRGGEEDKKVLTKEFSGKKKHSKGPTKGNAKASFDLLEDKQNNAAEVGRREVDHDKVEKEDEERVSELAAKKKKKKKKKKEKEKNVEEKQEVKNGSKSKLKEKKVPKYVREMQEALARCKEAEERRNREEDERLRKEEEEQCRQEEHERQAEEARRRKKERKKEKLLKKKAEGKLLTAKQKEKRRQLEATRNHFLSNGSPLPTSDNSDFTQRKIMKKLKPHCVQTNPANGQNTEEHETKQDAVLDNVKLETEMEEAEKINVEEEEEEEWDAKIWEDVNLLLPVKREAFEDEDALPLDKLAAIKEEEKPIEDSTSSISGAKKEILSLPTKNKFSGSKQVHSEAKAVGKNRMKEVAVNDETSRSYSQAEKSEGNLRSPICCIMGHVDAGKTKLLDCIRGTNVQEGEAGGITQQVGATFFPVENLRERTKVLKADAKLNVPGLLVIDTPGHESFSNLRSRGSGLCDIAILVVDLMHGLKQQTIESLNLLKMRNTEFIVALNKVDRIYGWKTCRNAPFEKAMNQQTKAVKNDFERLLTMIITQLKEQGLNSELYYENTEMGKTLNIVPTSAISGEGIPDLLLLLVQRTQKTMIEKLTFRNQVQCTVLEVQVVEGLGATIDVVLVNGVLHEGDQIVVCGMQRPIVTTIRALLTPRPMREIRVEATYEHHNEIKAAQSIKITAQGLEYALPGTGVYVVGHDDDVEDIMNLAMEDIKESVLSRIEKNEEGVYVQASTYGSLEALLEFLKSPDVNIPVKDISIGPVHKRDVKKAGIILEKKREYATILAFGVKVIPEAQKHADEIGVKIFVADVIYHLFDQFKAYIDKVKEEKKREVAHKAVFPCVLKVVRIFYQKHPVLVGVDVLRGIVKVGTPICIQSKDGFRDIGRIASIKKDNKALDIAKAGQKEVTITIVGSTPEEVRKGLGSDDVGADLVSRISRSSIDVLKEYYKDDPTLTKDEWGLIRKLKQLFKIQ